MEPNSSNSTSFPRKVLTVVFASALALTVVSVGYITVASINDEPHLRGTVALQHTRQLLGVDKNEATLREMQQEMRNELATHWKSILKSELQISIPNSYKRITNGSSLSSNDRRSAHPKKPNMMEAEADMSKRYRRKGSHNRSGDKKSETATKPKDLNMST